jgi:hypothetical protein
LWAASSELPVKMKPPAKWCGGFNEFYTRAEGPHIKASVVEGAVEPARLAHSGDQWMKMKLSPEIVVA